ncbi:MAG: pyridoxal phosphate-dependent aminotransferase [Clostridia bacterium]|nr:pyridoxal phosphate-dependent aminotransferase [Clostridia bacterium]
MKYDFDYVIDRKNTNSLKYDFFEERGRSEDLLPLWVADMDFRVPSEVTDALIEKARHGIFGYSEPKKEYFDAVYDWFSRRHGWKPDTSKFVLSCGVVYAICTLLQILTKEGDAVLIHQPVYYPFAESILSNDRKLVASELVEKDGVYSIDFEEFERAIVENDVKVYILCNPHNPVGRSWTKEELTEIGKICLSHGVFVISDEIHGDFTYEGHPHTVFATLGDDFERNCVVCTAPTKTFNIAGLHIANIYIPDDRLREKYKRQLARQGYSQSNVMGIVACQAAYAHGEEWFLQLKEYLLGNLSFVREYLKTDLPEIKLVEPQGTYLLWLDCRALGLSDKQLSRFIRDDAKLWLDDGHIFGKGGSGFERVNMACPRATLKEALDRLLSAVNKIRNGGSLSQ